jgi:hypothetical protein
MGLVSLLASCYSRCTVCNNRRHPNDHSQTLLLQILLTQASEFAADPIKNVLMAQFEFLPFALSCSLAPCITIYFSNACSFIFPIDPT